MTTSRQNARQSFLSFLIAIPAAALMLWAPYGLVHFVG
jgi:hypothetical protein